MSDLKDNVSIVKGIVEEVPIYKDLAQPALKEVGATLGTIAKTINIALSPLSALVWGYDKIKDYITNSLEEKLKNVPPEQIITPAPEVAGPALESLRFTGHNQNLRELYSNLLATSMNSSTAQNAHPAFVEIIKQLSTFDAIVLKELSEQNSHPIIAYRLDETEYSSFGIVGTMVASNLIKLDCLNSENSTLLATTIDNLVRSNLISVTYESQLADKQLYADTINAFNNSIQNHLDREFYSKEKFKNRKLNILYGTLEFTWLGLDFINSCVR